MPQGGIDLLSAPFITATPDRVRAHILLCVLAFYVEWHLRQAWEPILFEDEELALDRPCRDPVRPARASESARLKKKTHLTATGLPVQSFRTSPAPTRPRAVPEHVCRGRRSPGNDIPSGNRGRFTASRGDAIDQDVARNGNSFLT